MSARPDGIDTAARSRARRRAVQALYAWQLSGTPMREVIEQFHDEQDMEVADQEYFEALLRGIGTHQGRIDEALAQFLDRPIERVDPIERAVLRLAAFELMFREDVPYRVVINEAIEATKRFGADHGHTYINGVLDRAAGSWRAAEVAAARAR
ncbi:MAG TPA: transcription antitermination factor NusB [Xanthomonadaceae bacterium]|nr:transcription antitermination factor NusB [Xanthomonadaceae bacterium]